MRNQTVSVASVTVTRCEGLTEECGKPRTVDTIAEANAVLAGWSVTAPKGGAYDKCDFVVRFHGADDYQGRYDLKHIESGYPDIGSQIRRVCMIAAGSVPPGMDAVRCGRLRHTMSGEARAMLAEILPAVSE